MALFVRDPEVDQLVVELQRLTQAPTKTQAIKTALQAQLRHLKRQQPASQRIARARQLADAIGPDNPNFDMKKFTDELWEDQ
jgi:antitoxin VapB